MKRFFLVLLGCISILNVGFAEVRTLDIGIGSCLFSASGNLNLKGIPYEIDLKARIQKSVSGWEIDYCLFLPDLSDDDSLGSLKIHSLWLMRGYRFDAFSLVWGLYAGFGLGLVNDKVEGKESEYGSLGFRSDITAEVYKNQNVSVSTGISYRGMPLRETGEYTDRVGLSLSISRRFTHSVR